MGGDQTLLLKRILFLQCTKCNHKFGGQHPQTQIYKKSGFDLYAASYLGARYVPVKSANNMKLKSAEFFIKIFSPKTETS